MYFTIHYRMTHRDTIAGKSQTSTSTYTLGGIRQEQIPAVIVELNEKGYELLSVHHSDRL